MWRCVDVEMCRYGVVEMWMCGDVDMEIWSSDAAKLCLWVVEVLRYKTKTMSVNVIESCLY